MNLPSIEALEIRTAINAERETYDELARRLECRALVVTNFDPPLAHDLKRAALFLDLAAGGMAVFRPHDITGMVTMPREELADFARSAVEAMRPGLARDPVDGERAQAKDMVEQLYAAADRSRRGEPERGLPKMLRDAAMLLDSYQAGCIPVRPHAYTGWVLLPATVPAKLRAAVEGLVAAMEASDVDGPCALNLVCDAEDWDAAIAGGRSVLALLAEHGL